MEFTPESPLPRATRFPVAVSLRFRPAGQAHWLAGSSINMSRTGILFSTPVHPLPPGTPVEVRLRLPARTGGGAEFACRGTVIRTQPTTGPASESLMAIGIAQYTLRPPSPRRDAADPQREPVGRGE